jgi:hypothetical protein
VLSLSSTLRIFLAVEPADLRKGFDGLSQLVRDRIAQDPLSGHLYIFRNRRRDRIKILYWDRDGLALWYKTQTTDYPRSHWWNTPTVGGHNRPGGAAPPRGVVPTATGDRDLRRITMLGRPRPTAPPRLERPTDDR